MVFEERPSSFASHDDAGVRLYASWCILWHHAFAAPSSVAVEKMMP